MDDRERHEKGMARRRKVLGNAWVDRANANKTPFNEDFQDFITRYAWGEIWSARISTSARGACSLSARWSRSDNGMNSACICARR